MTATLSLFDTCPLPGCNEPIPFGNPGEPCDGCKAAFGARLRPTGEDTDPDEYAAELAARDQAVATHLAERSVMFTPIKEEPAEPEPEVEWRGNQACWVCEERRKCRHDPDRPELWICRDCMAAG